MKLNLKKIKLNQVILVVAILAIVGWLLMRSRRVENLEDAATASDIVLYVDSRQDPNPFIVYGMAKKMTNDEAKLEKILALAAEAKKDELLELVKTL